METRAFPCKICGTNVVAEVPAHQIINRPGISMFVMLHRQSRCSKCGQEYLFMLTGVKDMNIAWRLVDQEKEQAVSPPKGGLLTQ